MTLAMMERINDALFVTFGVVCIVTYVAFVLAGIYQPLAWIALTLFFGAQAQRNFKLYQREARDHIATLTMWRDQLRGTTRAGG
jgi:hypothetical protein